MASVKTAISIEPALYQQATATARKLRLSRSRLISVALDDYLRRLRERELSQRIDAAYAEGPDQDEKAALAAGRRRMRRRLRDDPW